MTIPANAPISSLNCSRLQRSAISKIDASGVVIVHSARESPALRQPVSSTCSASWPRSQSRNCSYGLASRSAACWQIASTLPLDSPTPNISRANSLAARREIRLRAVNVTIAASNRGPNAEDPTPSATQAVVSARQSGQRSRCVRCSTNSTADRRQLGDLVAPEPAAGPLLMLAELMPAAATRLRVVRDDLIDLILACQPTARSTMAFLPAGPALGTVLGQQLPGLRARLSTPLLTRLRQIRRRRLGTGS
jgi:hypothetical protein